MNELLKTENEIADLLEAAFKESKGLFKKEKTPRSLNSKLKKIKKILRLDNETQALIMAMLYDYRVKEENLTNRAIANHLDCELSDLAGVKHQINILFFGGYLIKIENLTLRCIELEKSLFYFILFNELDSYYKTLEVKGIHEFFTRVNIIANAMISVAKEDTVVRKDEYYEMYLNNFLTALAKNKNEKIIKQLEHIDYPNDYAKLIMYYLVYCMVFQGMDAFNVGNLLSAMFPIGSMLSELKEFFTSKGSILSQLGYIEPLKSDYQSGTIKFTKKFMKTYLTNDPELSKFLPEPNVEYSDVIKPVDIKRKKLFHNKEEEEKVDILTNAFKNDNLKDLMERLDSAGFSQGLTVLFHGYPGTGKTETAMQLAKLTGRSVMQVDFSQIRDMWVGNSEKNMKAVFESYYAYVEKTQDVPILLFNEADSVISKRITNIRGSVDQMNNTLQNILLQEMENFKGILIATTNLIDNIDNAFDRRFLYKVPFKKPDADNRTKIWKSRNKWLKTKEAKEIAEKYNFTGGQIENVTKKYVIDSALKGEKNDASVLLKYCEEEEFRSKGGSPATEFNGFK